MRQCTACGRRLLQDNPYAPITQYCAIHSQDRPVSCNLLFQDTCTLWQHNGQLTREVMEACYMTGNAGRCIIRFPMEGDHLCCCGAFLCLWGFLLSGFLCIEVLLPNENQLQVSAVQCPLISHPCPRALFTMNRLLLAQLYFAHFLFVLPRSCTF